MKSFSIKYFKNSIEITANVISKSLGDRVIEVEKKEKDGTRTKVKIYSEVKEKKCASKTAPAAKRRKRQRTR